MKELREMQAGIEIVASEHRQAEVVVVGMQLAA